MRRAAPRCVMGAMGCCRRQASACAPVATAWRSPSGHGLAGGHGLAPRQAIQPVDRLLSPPKRRREAVARCWVRCVVAERKARCVNVDGTEFEAAAQAMIVLGPQTEHGRRTPRV